MEMSIEVRASNNKNPESEDEDNPLKVSHMKELTHPAKSLYQIELNLKDEKIAAEEGYHTPVFVFLVISTNKNHHGILKNQRNF